MPYKLYYHPNTASLSTHWALVHLEPQGIKHTIQYVDFPSSEQKSPAYLSLNPKGRVPTLLTDSSKPESAITESSAILLYLAESHPSARLAPPPGHHNRVRFLEIYAYITNSLLPALRDYVYADKDGDEEGAEGVRALASRRIKQSWAFLDKELEGRAYLVDDEITVADFLAAATVSWTKGVERIAMSEENKNVRRWCCALKGFESWKEVVRREEGWVVREPPFEKDA